MTFFGDVNDFLKFDFVKISLKTRQFGQITQH